MLLLPACSLHYLLRGRSVEPTILLYCKAVGTAYSSKASVAAMHITTALIAAASFYEAPNFNRCCAKEVGFGAEANDALPSCRGGPPRRLRLKSEEKSQPKTRSAEQAGRQGEGGRSSDWPLLLCTHKCCTEPARPQITCDAVQGATRAPLLTYSPSKEHEELFANCHAITRRPINSLQLANIPSQFAIRFNTGHKV